MQLLHRVDVGGGIHTDGHAGGKRLIHGGGIRHLVLQGGATQLLGVLDRHPPFGGVDDVGVLAILDAVENVRATFVHLVDQARVDARFTQRDRGAVSGVELVAQLQQLGGQVDYLRLVAVTH